MVKLEVVIQPFKLNDVKAALEALGLERISIFEVLENGGPASPRAFYRGAAYCVDVPRVKLEMLVSSERAGEVIDAISLAARTRSADDDGIIVMYEVADAVRIRDGVHLQYALA